MHLVKHQVCRIDRDLIYWQQCLKVEYGVYCGYLRIKMTLPLLTVPLRASGKATFPLRKLR